MVMVSTATPLVAHQMDVMLEAATTPLVSMLVAAWNEAEMLPRMLTSFAALRYPNKELILCAGGEDGSEQIARRWESETIRVLRQVKGEGKRGALERCLAQANGTIVFLTDADCVLNDAGFEGMIRPILTREEQITTGTYRPIPEQQANPFAYLQWAKIHQRERHDPTHVGSHIVGRNTALLTDLYRAYLPQIPINTIVEDGYLGLLLQRDGIPIRWLPHCYVETQLQTAIQPYIRQQSRWMRGAWLTGRAFDSQPLVQHAQRTALYGFYLLATLLLILPFGFLGAIVASVSWGKAVSNYVAIGRILTKQHPLATYKLWIGGLKLLFADCIVWVRALTLDSWLPNRRGQW